MFSLRNSQSWEKTLRDCSKFKKKPHKRQLSKEKKIYAIKDTTGSYYKDDG